MLAAHEANAIALHIAHAWAFDTAEISPILLISSPQKRCGKSTLLNVVQRFYPRPLVLSNVTSAVIFRLIDGHDHPTLVMDEADTYIRRDREIAGIFNSGHKRSMAQIPRCTAETHEPRIYSTWAPKCMAMIGLPPDTILDRSIVIRLKRRLRNEQTTPDREKFLKPLEALKRKWSRWQCDSAQSLVGADPAFPAGLTNDRAADNWSHLFAIAELAGPAWRDRAHRAAVAMSGFDDGDDQMTIGCELLRDIRALFQTVRFRAAFNQGKVPSEELCNLLTGDKDLRWQYFNDEEPLRQKQLSRLLGEFGIRSKSIRIGDDATSKGFELSQFDEAFARYLPDVAKEIATSPQLNIGAMPAEIRDRHSPTEAQRLDGIPATSPDVISAEAFCSLVDTTLPAWSWPRSSAVASISTHLESFGSAACDDVAIH